MKLNEEQKNELIELCRSLIQKKSMSGKEKDVAEFIKKRMEELNYDKVWIDEYGSVIGKIKGKGNRSLVFEGHMDTVEVSNEKDWEHDPFGGEIIGNKMYGRGTSDMKGALSAMIYGASLIPREKIKGDVYVLGVVMEEIFEGIAFGNVLDEIKADCVVLGESTELNINVGQRGRAEVSVKTRGKSVHSSNPQFGVNAVYGMTQLVDQIRKIRFPHHKFLGKAIMELTDIISFPYPGASVVPCECKATFDRRLLAGETEVSVLKPLKESIERLKAQNSDFEADVEIAVGEGKTYTGRRLKAKRFFPAWILGSDHELAKRSLKAVKDAGIPASFSKYSFCTDGSQSAGIRGIPTIGFGPSKESLAHTTDEYIEIDQLVKAAEGYIAIAGSIIGT